MTTMVLSQLQYNYQTENRLRKKNNKPLHVMTIYDTLYTALFVMNECPMRPKSKTATTVSKVAQEMLIQKGFVKEVTDKDKKLLDNCEYVGSKVKYYIISHKGHEYLKRFEHLMELFDVNGE